MNVGFISNTTTSPISGYQATTASTGLNFTTAPITATLSYSGTTLTLNLTQGANTYTTTDTGLDLPTLLGASTAFVGFDANRMDQGVTISNFSYTEGGSSPVPEPSAFGYLTLGLASLAGIMRLRRSHLA